MREPYRPAKLTEDEWNKFLEEFATSKYRSAVMRLRESGNKEQPMHLLFGSADPLTEEGANRVMVRKKLPFRFCRIPGKTAKERGDRKFAIVRWGFSEEQLEFSF